MSTQMGERLGASGDADKNQTFFVWAELTAIVRGQTKSFQMLFYLLSRAHMGYG